MKLPKLPTDSHPFFTSSDPSNNVVPGRSFFRSLATRDFDELAFCFSHWDAKFQQLTPGAFEGSLQILQLPNLQIIQIRANRMIRAQGLQREKRFLFCPVTLKNAGGIWKGQQLKSGQIRLIDVDEEMNHRTSHGSEFRTLNIRPEFLHQCANRLLGNDVHDLVGNRFAFEPNPGLQPTMDQHLKNILKMAARSSTILNQARRIREIEFSCIDLVLKTLSAGSVYAKKEQKGPNRQILAQEVEAFMNFHLQMPLQIFDLCKEFDVSERTLDYAFRETFNLTPMAYFKVQKLNAVRHALKQASPQSTTVHETANQWGFWHTGAFAADYQRLFGELPSETLDS